MNEPEAYLNGRFLPASAAAVPVNDTGFMLGVTVAEQLRTFGGRLFRLEEHLERLERSLAIVDVKPRLTTAELASLAEELVARNYPLLPAGSDLGLTMFITPGPLGSSGEPLVCLHTRPLAFFQWARKYREGQWLVTTDVEQVSERSWPPELKVRSRVHYYLADRKADALQPGARALMLDRDGCVTEATTANVLIYVEGEGLLTPPAKKVLPGISLAVVRELARQLSIPLAERELTPADVAAADEVLLASTSPCVLPVARFNGQPIGGVGARVAGPGSVQQRLLSAWSKLVGFDIQAQASRFEST